MKTVKKLSGLCLALMMVLSLLVPVSAVDAWFGEGFEGTVTQVKETWTTTNDAKWSLATNRVHTGKQSLKMTAYNAISFTLNPAKAQIKKGVYEIWMYDGAGDTGRNNLAVTTSDGKTVTWGTLYKNPNYYLVTATNESTVTTAPRKTGWRQIVLDLTQPFANMYIDGVQCLTSSNTRLSADQLNLINAFKIFIAGTGSGDCYWDDLAFYESYADVPQHPSTVIGSAKFASGTDVADAVGITADDGNITLTFSKTMSALSASQVKLYQRASNSTNDGDFVEVTGVTASGITDTSMTIHIPNLSYLKTYKLEYVGLKSGDGKAVSKDFITFTTAASAASYDLTVQKTGNGTVSYQGNAITAPIKIAAGVAPELSIVPDQGHEISFVTVNGANVTSQVANQKITLAEMKDHVTVAVDFREKTVLEKEDFLHSFEESLETLKETWGSSEFLRVSGQHVHSGKQSLMTQKDGTLTLNSEVYQARQGVYTFWIYDDLSQLKTATTLFRVTDSSGKYFYWGIKRDAYGEFYSWGTPNEYQKSVARVAGWHRITVDFASTNDQAIIYLDGEKIRVGTSRMDNRLIEKFEIYSAWSSNNYSFWIDDLAIYESLSDLPKHWEEGVSSITFASGKDADGATEITDQDGKITLKYAQDMNALDPSSVTVKSRMITSDNDAEYTLVSGASVQVDGNSFVITTPSLSPMKTYRIDVGEQEILSGGKVAGHFFTFGTEERKVTDVIISGNPQPGKTVTGVYTYTPIDGEADDSVYQWLIADSQDGTYAPITGATAKTYTILDSQQGKWLKFVVKNGEFTVESAPIDIKQGQSIGTPTELYVALDGNDANNGSISAPFATLEGARDAIRLYRNAMPDGGITVYVRGGVYHLNETFRLEEQDSGTAENPIVYRAYPGEKVTFSGGTEIDWSKFSKVNGSMKSKLNSTAAQNNVMVADLDEIGLGQIQKITFEDNFSKMVAPLFIFNGQTMKVSRWPDSEMSGDWPTANTLNGGKQNRTGGGTGFMTMKLNDETILSFTHNPQDLFVYGFWQHNWYGEYLYPTLNTTEKTLMSDRATQYGALGDNRPYCVLHVYEEISQPGEWYIDWTARKFYCYPIGNTSEVDFRMTNAEFDLVHMNNTSYVTLYGFELTGGKENGVIISGGTKNLIDNCNINTFEKKAVLIDGVKNGISNSHVHHCGTGGVVVTGGNKETITEAENFVFNCEINDYSLLLLTYAPGVDVDGVGNKISHNEFYNSPHAAILFGGVENVMEYNSFHEVCLNATDMGAIYTGRDFRDHGNVIQYNHFYNIGQRSNNRYTANGVFTDDGSSDLLIYGNYFGPGMDHCEAVKVHGGVNNNIINNIFIDTPTAFRHASWSLQEWQAKVFSTNSASPAAEYADRMKAVNNNPLYLEKWPWLKTTHSKSTLTYPSCQMRNNLILFVDIENKDQVLTQRIKWPVWGYSDQQTNLILDQQPKSIFVDAANGNYQVQDSVYQQIPQMEQLPFESIGRIQTDESDLLREITVAKKLISSLIVGTKIGQYPAGASASLDAAIQRAEKRMSEGQLMEQEIIELVLLLQTEEQALQEQVISTVVTSPGEEVILPESGMEKVTITAEGMLTLTIPGNASLPEMVITGSILIDGEPKTVEMTLPAGTVASQQTTLTLFRVSNQPSVTMKGTRLNVMNFSGNTTLSQPLTMRISGAKGKWVSFVENGKAASAKKSDTTVTRNVEGKDLIVTFTGFPETILYTAVDEPEESPTIAPPANNPPVSAGTGSVGSASGNRPAETPAVTGDFYDITGHWAETDISDMANRGIVSGVTANTFEPDRFVTRAEFATLISRAFNLGSTVSAGFTDVEQGAWYENYVNAVANAGLITGYEGAFRPEDLMTREEMAVVLAKAYAFMGKTAKTGGIEKFEDRNVISGWAREYVDQMTAEGLLFGMTADTFEGAENTTRAQATSVLKRLLDRQ